MHKRVSSRLAALLLLASAAPVGATDLIPSTLAGTTWQVVAIDGKPVEPPRGDDENNRPPAFTFGHRAYGGNAGCNGLGGLYAQVGDRIYTMPGPQTQMGCGGALGEQEAAANALLAASPTLTRDGETAVLAGGGHRMELRWLRPAGDVDSPSAWQGPSVAHQRYVVHAVNGERSDGKRVWSEAPPELRFSATRATMKLDCPREAEAPYTLGTEFVQVTGLAAPCTVPRTRDAALAAILNSGPRTVSGPNGELLLASRAGWAILWNERRDRPK